MTDAKIQGKFYPLQHEEWLRACRELTPSQRDVLYYLRTIDPYSNGFRISAAQIARDLSTPERKVHRQTISRALKELDAKGFIDLELIEVQVCITPKGYWCQKDISMVCGDTSGVVTHQGCDETPTEIATHQGGSPHTRVDHDTPTEITTHQAVAETPENTPLQEPKTNKDYLDFLDSLSEAERENFEKFVRDSWRKITAKNGEPGKEIISLERFLNKPSDLKNWWQKFLNSPTGHQAKKKAATGQDWYKDPRFNEWIWAAFERGYEWVHENEAEREVRKAFYDWAFAVNAFEGVCV
jgi:Fe2+ or Zn2+ uptake regulation protein